MSNAAKPFTPQHAVPKGVVATRWWWVRHAPVREDGGCIYGQADLGCDTSDRVVFAAVDIPQAFGYTRIAGMPVVTGLYGLLLPLVAFGTFGSSRYLVVAADSATAAILRSGLNGTAPSASPRYVALASLVALLTAGFLLLARLLTDPAIPARKFRLPPTRSAIDPEMNLPAAYTIVPADAMAPSLTWAWFGVTPCCARS